MSDETRNATGSKTAISPMLCVKDAAEAIRFYERAFGARVVMRLDEGDGRVSHAEVRVGEAGFSLADEYPEIQVFSPQTLGDTAVMLLLEVPDADAVFQRAVDAGARVDRPLQDAFDGKMRNGKLTDPYGHRWMIATFK